MSLHLRKMKQEERNASGERSDGKRVLIDEKAPLASYRGK
jgi:hypothetical protein